MNRIARISLFLTGSAIAIGLVACESILGADFGDVKEVDCAHVAPPGPPAISSSPIEHDLVFVTDAFDLGEADDDSGGKYRSIGYDLDGVCSDEGQPPDCASPAWAQADPTDGVDGRDNAIGQLVHGQASAFGSTVFVSSTLSAEVPQNKIAPIAIFHVTGFSGGADDDHVTVEWYTPALPLPNLAPVDWSKSPVTIPVSYASVTSSDPASTTGTMNYAPKFVDANAYVTHSTLVAHFGAGPAAQIINVPFNVVSAVVTGTINGSLDHMTGGTMAGIVKMTDMFHFLPQFTKTLIGAPVCHDDPYFKEIKSFYCKFVDIRTSGAPDSNAPCDGDSFGVAFETRAAVLGPAVDDSVPELCPNAVDIDDCNAPP